MRSVFVFVPLLSATVLQFPGCPFALTTTAPEPTPTPAQVTFDDGFESGLVNWVQDADVPDDPNEPGHDVAASVELSQEQAFEGIRSARLSLDGRQGDGTLWIEHQFALVADQNYRVTLTFELWSGSASGNTLAEAAAFAGNERPRREADFDLQQKANQVGGWKQYTYIFDFTTDATGRLWVACGINAVLETEFTYFIDDVKVKIDPR